MSLKTIYDKQPDSFEFSFDNLKIAENILKKYPEMIPKMSLILKLKLILTKL